MIIHCCFLYRISPQSASFKTPTINADLSELHYAYNMDPVVDNNVAPTSKAVPSKKRSVDKTASVGLLSRTFSTYSGTAKGVKVFVSESKNRVQQVHWIEDEGGCIHFPDTSIDELINSDDAFGIQED